MVSLPESPLMTSLPAEPTMTSGTEVQVMTPAAMMVGFKQLQVRGGVWAPTLEVPSAIAVSAIRSAGTIRVQIRTRIRVRVQNCRIAQPSGGGLVSGAPGLPGRFAAD